MILMTSLEIEYIDDLEHISNEITELYFTEYFKRPLCYISPQIKKITFDDNCRFDHCLNNLPNKLEELVFSDYRDHTLEEIKNLPQSLKKLVLGGNFNKKITENILPPNLTHLIFGSDFNQELIRGVLPPNLKYLALNQNYNKPLKKGVLSDTLNELCFYNYEDKKKELVLPNKLKKLTFNEYTINFGNI